MNFSIEAIQALINSFEGGRSGGDGVDSWLLTEFLLENVDWDDDIPEAGRRVLLMEAISFAFGDDDDENNDIVDINDSKPIKEFLFRTRCNLLLLVTC